MNNLNFENTEGCYELLPHKSLDEQLEEFMVNFHSVRATRYDTYIVYSVLRTYADSQAEKANKLIEKLGLDLKAESNSRFGFFSDSILISKK